MTAATYDVAGLGNAIVDVISPVEDAFLDALDIRKNGMTLIDEPRAELLTEKAGSDAVTTSGGSGANTIAGLGSFGGKAAYFGKVADDALGKVFREETEAAGVTFPCTPLQEGPATARSIIFVTPDGARSMNTYLGATTLFSPSDIDEDIIRASAITYLEGYLFDRDEAKAAFVHAAEVATAAGRQTALTLSDSFCVDRHRESFLHLIRGHIDILFANEEELLSLYQVEDFDEALDRLEKDVKVAAITRSEKGSVLMTKTERISLPAEPIEKVVDTTGAGDQYAAGLLFGLARGLPLADAGRLGHIAAAEVISHYGPRPEVSLKALAEKAGLAL